MTKSKLKNIFLYSFPLLAFAFLCIQHYCFLLLDNSPIQGIDFDVLKPYSDNFFYFKTFCFMDGIAPHIISQINNMFFNILFFFSDADFLTSYHWANIFYALLSIILLCKCSNILYGKNDYSIKNMAIFIFITLPVFPSAIKRHYIHYQEAVLFILCCFTYLKYCKKSTLINGVILSLCIVALCSIYYSGLFYSAIFSFFFFIAIITNKNKPYYTAIELLLYSLLIFSFTEKQIALIIQEGLNRFSDDINMVTTFNFGQVLLASKIKAARFFHYIVYSAFMPLYLSVIIVLIGCAFKTKFYMPSNKTRFIFLSLQGVTLISMTATMIVANLGIDQVATPAFIPLVFFIIHLLFALRLQKRLYKTNYILIIAAGTITTFFSFFPQQITHKKTHAVFTTDKKCFPDFTYRPINNKFNINKAISSVIKKHPLLNEQPKLTVHISNPQSFFNFSQAYHNFIPETPIINAHLLFILQKPNNTLDKFLKSSPLNMHVFENPNQLKELFAEHFNATSILETHVPIAAIYTPFNLDLYMPPNQLWFIFIKKELDSYQTNNKPITRNL